MDNQILNKIKDFAVNELKNAYGYCGCADGPKAVMINTDDNKGSDIIITIFNMHSF